MEVLIKCITLKSHGRGGGGMGVKTEDDWKKRGEQKRGEREKETEKRERGQTRERKNKTRKGQRDKEIKMQNLGMGGSLL